MKRAFFLVEQLLVWLGKPGYYLLFYGLKWLELGKKMFFFQKKLFFRRRSRGRPKKLSSRIKKILLKFFRLSKNFLRRLKKTFLVLKKIRFKKRKRGRPRKKSFRSKLPTLNLPRKKRLALILIIIGSILILLGIIIKIFSDLPSPDHLIQRKPSLTTKIYDRNGILLYKIYRNQNRTLVPLKKIPSYFIEATLAIEDKEFYFHNGLSWRGILRALKHNLLHPNEPPIGGSTITQQLVKNALLSPEKSWRRKIREAILALLVEIKF